MSEENENNEDKTPGRICWTELMSHDLEGSKKFYGELLGWKYEEMKMPNGGSYVFGTPDGGGKPTAGLMQLPPEAGKMPTSWGTYITVEDLAASVEKAKSLGATVVRDITEIPMGKFAFIADPQGGVIGLWETGECPE